MTMTALEWLEYYEELVNQIGRLGIVSPLPDGAKTGRRKYILELLTTLTRLNEE